MPDNENAAEEKRMAIVVGINRYNACNDIPVLAGAENDAREIYQRLTAGDNFTIEKKYLLLGYEATRGAILKAVSDIFHKGVNNCSLVIFYFSGHGIVDEYNQGYIAPYDMDPEDPFVYGINMEELRNVIYKSKINTNVIILLDCCYAGIATDNFKAMAQPDLQTKNLYADHLKKFIESPGDQSNNKNRERGKIILASSEPDQKSREKNDCVHLNLENPHSHGTFSFHLIEGLDGKAADPDTGVVTVDNLRRHIEKQMIAEGKQKPIYSIAEASQLENIKLAISPAKFKNKISQLISKIEEFIYQKSDGSSLVDIQSLTEAAKKLSELVSLDATNKEITRLAKAIDDLLHLYEEPLVEWLTKSTILVRPKVIQIHPLLYDDLFTLVEKLSYNELKKIDHVNLQYLIILSNEIIRKTEYISEDDEGLRILLLKLKVNFRSSKNIKDNSGI
jgi:Caspase domain